MGQGIDGGLTANLLHTSLIDSILGKSLRAKVEITYLFLRGGGDWWHYSNVLHICMDAVLGICFLRGCCVTLLIYVVRSGSCHSEH